MLQLKDTKIVQLHNTAKGVICGTQNRQSCDDLSSYSLLYIFLDCFEIKVNNEEIFSKLKQEGFPKARQVCILRNRYPSCAKNADLRYHQCFVSQCRLSHNYGINKSINKVTINFSFS